MMERSTAEQDWLTLIVFIWLTILAYIRMTFPVRLQQFAGSLFGEQYAHLYDREERWLFNSFNLPIGILFFMSLAFVALRTNSFIPWLSTGDDLPAFVSLFLVFLVLYITRTFPGLFIGRLFRIETTVRYALLLRYSSTVPVSGIWFAAAVLSLYLPAGQKAILYTGLTAGCLLLLWAYVQIFRKVLKRARLYFHYLVLYLCALEIAPVLLVARWLTISH